MAMHIVAPLLGLTAGYLVLCYLGPQYDFLGLMGRPPEQQQEVAAPAVSPSPPRRPTTPLRRATIPRNSPPSIPRNNPSNPSTPPPVRPIEPAPSPPAVPSVDPALAPSLLTGSRAGETRDDNGLKMKFVWCPPGTFTMGSPPNEPGRASGGKEDQVSVTLTHGFWLGQTEVTQGQWQAVMGTTPWKGQRNVKEGANYSASYVSWNDAAAYCQKLSESERVAGSLPVDWEYTLPTEAQWEYACRAGTTTRYHFGNDVTALTQHAWYNQNANNLGKTYAHEVGQKLANPWGLYDINGNVWEWCQDWFTDKLPGGTDPTGSASGSRRATRGGSWGSTTEDCRSALRNAYEPDYQQFYLGFRVALVPVAANHTAQLDREPANIDAAKPLVFAGSRAGETWDENGLKMKFVWCPPGTFTMGSPADEPGRGRFEDQVSVTLTSGFWLGQMQVTQGQWQAVMDTTPWKRQRNVKEGNNYAASYVTWNDAAAYCKKLTESELAAGRLSPDWQYALPTEAQWEYACRAGTTTWFHFGNIVSPLSQYAWYGGNANAGEPYAREVGLKLANPWGLHDMHGNVWEWCRDWYAPKLPGETDPTGPTAGSNRIIRGGSWDYAAAGCRSAARAWNLPSNRHYFIGFRVALVPVAANHTAQLDREPANIDAAKPLVFAGSRAGETWDENGLKMKFVWCPREHSPWAARRMSQAGQAAGRKTRFRSRLPTVSGWAKRKSHRANGKP